MLRPGDVGQRVVVRRFVRFDADGRPLHSDLLGELVSVDEEYVVVRADDGVEHTVPLESVAASRPIPPRPARFSEIAALERVADRAWPAPVHEPLGGWILRAASGFTGRANSALALGDPGLLLPDAISACVDWYDGRGLPPRITVPLPMRRAVADALTALGWYAQPLVLVQTAPLAGMPEPPTPAGLRLRESPSVDFLGLVAARKGGLPAAAIHVLTAVESVRFAEVRGADGALLAIARGAVVDGWLHLGLVEVVEPARGRGLALAVSLSLAEWAGGEGADRVVLQVEEENRAAVELYAGLGFTTHHRYLTFRLPPPATLPAIMD